MLIASGRWLVAALSRLTFRSRLRIALLCIVLLLIVLPARRFASEGWIGPGLLSASHRGNSLQTSLDVEKNGPFIPLPISGFDVHATSNDALSCHAFQHSTEVSVQRSFFLDDDVWDIAKACDVHPMVQYPVKAIKAQSTSIDDMLIDAWDELALACAFLPTHHVYLCVSRLIFHPGDAKDHARINFLRGRIYSEEWVHLHGYRMKWEDQEEQVFPLIFDTHTEYKLTGLVYGPEDARIIVEDVPGAEPLIIFNMMSSQSGWKRTMWLFRPFTKKITMLAIENVTPSKKEKNWSPFFIREDSTDHRPSTYVHVTWTFSPLKVLKCHLDTGICTIVFSQLVSDEELLEYKSQNVSLRGGTPLIPIPRRRSNMLWSSSTSTSTDVQAFLSLPRHHINHNSGCGKPGYRPEFSVLITNSTHFYVSYISAPIDFGPDIVMSTTNLSDACGAGRIMIVNSIARWQFGTTVPGGHKGQYSDLMTLTLSVNDETEQVVRVAGLYDALRSLPSLNEYFAHPSGGDSFPPSIPPAMWAQDLSAVGSSSFERVSTAAWKVRRCVEEEARRYTMMHSKTPNLYLPS